MIVADAGPIIGFACRGRLDLLRQVVGDLVVPAAVYEELVGRERQRPGTTNVEQGGWIQRKMVTDRMAPAALHMGEGEAIVLAHELNTQLLIDERRGRNLAIAHGLEVIGALRVFTEAKQLGIIDRVKLLVDALLSAGYWIDEELLIPFFREASEEDSA
jgi:predicted nucleic acid-binding protein